ncbi:uncharacterized protein CANTADRAFT_6476 [Suhomyces tanzawaensis NRRL Y-17324]|uniref:BHLH domain-containing protein n=1 Tax=Suhomyces tanzawaensis NRRL Y-17324 TaxID=984487 RepID=A0A1E4SIL2_9ASCO|nr:uncharacterized protein CANTADRAFT_6476 [Suhomyces tanzawaensis NRRL Y-17324]ODV79339.1 hypothetical protein CANTADRAFT_6476 [Suhomyces tanzawaensis NRRL Y-17324]
MTILPNPPVLKTTIIQLNKELDSDDHNYEILTNDYLSEAKDKDGLDIIANTSSSLLLQKKKRRRSLANVDSEELAKRKHETKQLHSIIEKRRRIKINREFEALKYLIPACRSTSPVSNINSPTIKPNNKQSSTSNNNGNKIDGMYKLTILKASVEYILYLHHVIQKQNELLQGSQDSPEFDLGFAKVPLDVNQYRNIDKEFNFKDLLNEIDTFNESPSSEESRKNYEFGTIHEEAENHELSLVDAEDDLELHQQKQKSKSLDITSDPTSQLLSPEITPDMAPILTMLNKYSSTVSSEARKASLPISPHTILLHSNATSPLTNPIKSAFSTPLLSSKLSKSQKPGDNKFSLPDPAINLSAQICEPPKKKLFKSKPLNTTIVFGHESRTPSSEYEDTKLSDQDASKTLLALRKSSIDSLLN